jgi:Glycosyl-4,4'-diaponeurosporenoate acyltransferase
VPFGDEVMSPVAIAIAVALAVAAFVIVTRRSNQQFSPHVTILGRMALAIVVGAVLGVTLYLFGRFTGHRSPLFAVIAAADALGFVGLTRPAFHWTLPGFLNAVRPWEREVYRSLGVPEFGELLRRPPIRYLNSMVYLRGQGGDLGKVRARLLDAEGAHFWGVVLTIPLMACMLSQGWWDSLAWALVFHVVFNAYPAFHLRSVRARIERIAGRTQALSIRRTQV